MKKLLRTYLEENITAEKINEEFDYRFGTESNYDDFVLEYKKFLGLYSGIFYSEDRFLTVFNSYEIRLNIKDIEQLVNLLVYSIDNNLENEKYILLDFLYTYNNTINSKNYKNNYSKYKESKDEFESVLNKFNYRKKFFTESIETLNEFYRKLINYAFENNIFVDGAIINRIFNNLKRNNEYVNEIINLFINKNTCLCNIIKFDNEKSKHVNIYLAYILESLDKFGGYNYAKEIFYELDKSDSLNNEFSKSVINKYVQVVNNLFKKLKNENEEFIRELSQIENLKNELNYILKNIKILNEIEKKKIKECLKLILYMKRKIISNDEYAKNSMHEFKYETKIPNEEIDKYKSAINENEFRLYAASKINFDTEIQTALKSYSNYPLQSIISSYHIDSRKSIYSIGIEDRKKQDNNFKKYFDEKGKEYTQNNNDLMNKLYKDYYEELLKYLSKTFNLHQELVISTIGDNDFEMIINKLKKSINYDYNNNYAVVVSNILAIECNIINFMKRNNIEIEEDGFDNINKLVEKYKDNKEIINGLMYLNYILYEKSGLNLRNYFMHGMLINSNMDIPLLVTFAGLIFVSWLLNGN